jgi:hypothetical protein
MFSSFIRSIFIVFVVTSAAVLVNAQGSDATTRSGNPAKEELPTGIKESLAKQRIEREKKDFAEMVEHSEEALKLTDQLAKSYGQNSQFSAEDQKKLDRLEKVVKKIRNELGGDDDEESVEQPASIGNALESLKANTSKLVDAIKQTSRYTVSVVAVESSNALLKMVRFLRLRKN